MKPQITGSQNINRSSIMSRGKEGGGGRGWGGGGDGQLKQEKTCRMSSDILPVVSKCQTVQPLSVVFFQSMALKSFRNELKSLFSYHSYNL